MVPFTHQRYLKICYIYSVPILVFALFPLIPIIQILLLSVKSSHTCVTISDLCNIKKFKSLFITSMISFEILESIYILMLIFSLRLVSEIIIYPGFIALAFGIIAFKFDSRSKIHLFFIGSCLFIALMLIGIISFLNQNGLIIVAMQFFLFTYLVLSVLANKYKLFWAVEIAIMFFCVVWNLMMIRQ